MVTFTEAKRLIQRWGRGTFPTRPRNIWHHVNTRGKGDLWQYLRKAYSFNKKGTAKSTRADGTVLYKRKNGEFLIERDEKIVTYGINKRRQ